MVTHNRINLEALLKRLRSGYDGVRFALVRPKKVANVFEAIEAASFAAKKTAEAAKPEVLTEFRITTPGSDAKPEGHAGGLFDFRITTPGSDANSKKAPGGDSEFRITTPGSDAKPGITTPGSDAKVTGSEQGHRALHENKTAATDFAAEIARRRPSLSNDEARVVAELTIALAPLGTLLAFGTRATALESTFVCRRCGHHWHSKATRPASCPACRATSWDGRDRREKRGD